jgi:hypothetical protein
MVAADRRAPQCWKSSGWYCYSLRHRLGTFLVTGVQLVAATDRQAPDVEEHQVDTANTLDSVLVMRL